LIRIGEEEEKKTTKQAHLANEFRGAELTNLYVLLQEAHEKRASQLSKLQNCCKRTVQYLYFLLQCGCSGRRKSQDAVCIKFMGFFIIS